MHAMTRAFDAKRPETDAAWVNEWTTRPRSPSIKGSPVTDLARLVVAMTVGVVIGLTIGGAFGA